MFLFDVKPIRSSYNNNNIDKLNLVKSNSFHFLDWNTSLYVTMRDINHGKDQSLHTK